MNDTINLLMNHMSIRKFQDKPVDREKVNTIIKCGQMAPTSSHFQTYTIIEVQNRSKKEILAEIAGGQKWVKEAPLVLLFCADLNRSKKYYENIDTNILSNTESYSVAIIDTALVMQKCFIAAQSLGLGGVVVGGIRNDVEKISKEFKLPEMVAPLFLLCLGYPDQNPGLKPRLPQEEIHKIDYYDDSNQDNLINEYNETVKNYYLERSNGKEDDTWTKRCSQYLIAKPRYEVGNFFRKIGFLKK